MSFLSQASKFLVQFVSHLRVKRGLDLVWHDTAFTYSSEPSALLPAFGSRAISRLAGRMSPCVLVGFMKLPEILALAENRTQAHETTFQLLLPPEQKGRSGTETKK